MNEPMYIEYLENDRKTITAGMFIKIDDTNSDIISIGDKFISPKGCTDDKLHVPRILTVKNIKGSRGWEYIYDSIFNRGYSYHICYKLIE